MEKDTNELLEDVRASSSGSLSSRILEIQRKAQIEQPKTAMQACVEVNLRAGETPYNAATPIELRNTFSGRYIAVSYPWKLLNEKTTPGRYQFFPEHPPGVDIPQDVILDRVLNFKVCNPDYYHMPIWIDKLCINQHAGDEKEIAVQSMDRVYQYSPCTLGLLFTKIASIDDLSLLARLLDGDCAKLEGTEFILTITRTEGTQVMELIESILQDQWWHRAWIFQEEFLASKNMILLLPCCFDHSKRFQTHGHASRFGKTRGEIEIRALDFRTMVTTFCLALSACTGSYIQDRCLKVLEVAGKYNELYRTAHPIGAPFAIHAMSPAIFHDIGSREIGTAADLLAIIANCCRYVARLNTETLKNLGESLSTAILALYVINGEILRHDSPAQEVLNKTVFKCLRREALQVHPPIQRNELMFTRYCRLPTVKLSRRGMVTWGNILRLTVKIRVGITSSTKREYWENNDRMDIYRLNGAEKSILWALSHHLEAENHLALARFLTEFVEARSSIDRSREWGLSHIQLMMVKYICRKIAEGQDLWLARVDSEEWKPYVAIFAPETALDDKSPMYAFVSSGYDRESKYDRASSGSASGASLSYDSTISEGTTTGRPNARIALLRVSFEPHESQIIPQQWMNGLWISKRSDAVKLTIPWPTWMQ